MTRGIMVIQYLAIRANMDVEKALKQEHDRRQLAQNISRKQVRPSRTLIFVIFKTTIITNTAIINCPPTINITVF